MRKHLVYLTLLGASLLLVPVAGQIVINDKSFLSNSGTASGPIGLPDGTAAAPAIYFISDPALGFRRTASSSIYISNNTSATDFGIGPIGSSNGMKLNGGGTSGIIVASLSKIAWTLGTEQNTQDASLSRTAAGVVAVGTGAQGSTAGQIAAALHINTGSGLTVANVGANSCGTTAATIAGGANGFVITVGATSGTQCRVAFPVAATTEYNCTSTDSTTTIATRTTPVDTTHTDFFGAFVAGDKVTGICFPR